MSHLSSGAGEESSLPVLQNENLQNNGSCHSMDKDTSLTICRVCQCAEPDRRGNAALEFLGISPPKCELGTHNEESKSNFRVSLKNSEYKSPSSDSLKGSELVEFISPSGEVFVCTADVELGVNLNHNHLIELGCSCKNDLSLAHYACALKWFINHGSTVCEICGSMATNIRSNDFKKILVSLKKYETLMEGIVNGQPNPSPTQIHTGVDPDAVAAIRRQRLSEISSWFNPHNSYTVTASQVVNEQPSASDVVVEEERPTENTATKWAVECTAILLATGLLTVTLAWLIAPHVGKKTAKNGLHILLGGVCALTVVVFFRFFVLTRIKYGPARYWAILFIFWFLVFGIWASRTHGSREM